MNFYWDLQRFGGTRLVIKRFLYLAGCTVRAWRTQTPDNPPAYWCMRRGDRRCARLQVGIGQEPRRRTGWEAAVRDGSPQHGGAGVEHDSCGRRCPPSPAGCLLGPGHGVAFAAQEAAEGALVPEDGFSLTLPKKARLQRGLLCKSTVNSWFCCFNNSRSLKLGIEKL